MTTEPDFGEDTRDQMAAIEANWDERTPIHAASRFYDVAGRDPESWFAGFEWADLGDLAGRDVLHLQCHLGTETAAFARRGAAGVVGLDVSAAAVAEAGRIAAAAHLPIEYVRANVYDAVEALGGRQFDVIYTGKGALGFLPDLGRWARTIGRLLRPGGIASVVEFHPLLHALGLVPRTPEDRELRVRHDYLGGRGARRMDATHTYTDGPALSEATISYEWAHGIGEVVTALLGAGLTVRSLRESDEIAWLRWQQMVPGTDGFWRLPDDAPRIPLVYALVVAKPAEPAVG